MEDKRFLVSLLLLFLTACSTSTNPDLIGLDGDGVGPTKSSELQPESQMPIPEIADPADIPKEMIVIEESSIPKGAETFVELARQRLVSKFGFELDEIHLISVTLTDWPNASLGCPQPGLDYSQVITPGYQILFQTGFTVYTFHTDTGERVVLCQEQLPDNIYIEP